ncbi:MAG: imidazolonepropionase [Acidobacteria bacterium]|nr:MAG: imidazolonepropionase [Acidobacteriota bacterium]
MDELLITGLGEIATPEGTAPRCGAAQGEVRRLRGGEVLCRDGRIAFVGPAAERRRELGELPGVPRLDGGGGTLVPGFVDAHTHLPWAGSREEEFAQRLAGKTYLEIAAAGGGILSTVRATRAASEDQLVANTRRRLDAMLAWGTTTAEVKSGYGLDLDNELKQLRAIRRAGDGHPIDVVPTLLAAHEFPPEHRHQRQRYVDEIVDSIIPAAAAAGLARFCDVFCERGVFEVDAARQVLLAGRRHGLLPRLHADEFADSGGASLAAELGAVSADHLVAISDPGIAALAAAGTFAVLLPVVSFFLMKERYAPARRLIEAGVPVVLASDCNPGSSHTESLIFVLQLAVFMMRMSVAECLTAITLNAACCLGLGAEAGSIEVGKRADLVLLAAPNMLHLAYHPGINPVAAVIKGGRLVAGGGADGGKA